MSLSVPYMPLFVADYLADTAHLSAAEHGAYLLLIMNYWQRQKPLPSDDKKLARIARMTDAEWQDARDTILEFFTVVDGELRHKRIEAELARVSDKISKAKAAGEKSAAARAAAATVEPTFNGRSTDAELLGKAKQDKGSDDDAALARATVLATLEPACREAVADTTWPVVTSQDLHRLVSLAVDEGLNPETEIIPAVRQQAERAKASGKRVSTWGYFAPGCREFAAAARSPPPSVVPMPARNQHHGARNERLTPLQAVLAERRRQRDSLNPGNAGEPVTIDAVALPG